MVNLICIRHPDYDGTSSPVLACKTCCSLFLTELKRQTEVKSQGLSTEEWLAEKAREAREAETKKTKFGFDPITI